RAAYNGEFENLRQEGLLSLIRAAELFDYRRGLRFSTFASKHISGAVKKAAREARPSAAFSLDYECENDDGETFTLHESIEQEPSEDRSMDRAEARRELEEVRAALDRHYQDCDAIRVCRCGCGKSLRD